MGVAYQEKRGHIGTWQILLNLSHPLDNEQVEQIQQIRDLEVKR
jgi:hypothetical protein